MDEVTLTVRTFECGTDKEAARKPAEEALEVYAAWEVLGTVADVEGNGLAETIATLRLADEIADCITACCNLAANGKPRLHLRAQRHER